MTQMRLHYDSNDRDDGSIERCPFCGGEGIVDCHSPLMRRSVYYFVRCDNCGALTWPWAETPAKAIEMWNRRAQHA